MATPNLLTITTSTPKVLYSGQIAGTADALIYTAPSGKAARLANGSICNVSGSAVTVGVGIVPSGGSLDGTHKLVAATFSLAAGDTLPLKDLIEGHYLGDGDGISIIAGTGNALDVVITGVELS